MELDITLNKTNKISKKELLRFILFLLLFLGIVFSTAMFIQYMHENNNKEQNENKWEKNSGKSGKHKNVNAKKAAKEKWLKAKERLQQLKQQKRTKEIAKQIRKAENEVKHWLKKMNETGETHRRQGK